MKVTWVLDLDDTDDAERVATDIINHPLVNSLAQSCEATDLTADQWTKVWADIDASPDGHLYGAASDTAIKLLSDLGYNADTAPESIQSAIMVGYILGMRDR